MERIAKVFENTKKMKKNDLIREIDIYLHHHPEADEDLINLFATVVKMNMTTAKKEKKLKSLNDLFLLAHDNLISKYGYVFSANDFYMVFSKMDSAKGEGVFDIKTTEPVEDLRPVAQFDTVKKYFELEKEMEYKPLQYEVKIKRKDDKYYTYLGFDARVDKIFVNNEFVKDFINNCTEVEYATSTIDNPVYLRGIFQGRLVYMIVMGVLV